MSGLFGGGSKDVPEPAVVTEEEKKKIRQGAKKNTILTGPLGLIDEPLIARATLLGE